MDDAVRELYQEVILDHSKNPRNFRVPAGASRQAKGHNPLCGDRLTLFLEVEGGVVKSVGFQGAGCAISTASASMMTDAIKGKTEAEAEEVFAVFHDLVTGKPGPRDTEKLGKLAVFAGVRDYPVRVKCATLAWHTLRAALAQQEEAVSTE
ncbi:MAG: Fe-S cluster assembly sulfur transfer protein SufU [Vicinamibacteria bacterium]